MSPNSKKIKHSEANIHIERSENLNFGSGPLVGKVLFCHDSFDIPFANNDFKITDSKFALDVSKSECEQPVADNVFISNLGN